MGTEGRIFISYRRSDAAAAAGRLFDRLTEHFGKSVFMDVDTIPIGTDFTQYLQNAVASASVMLVVIGPRWIEAKSADGTARLQNPHDFVRLEIEAALDRRVPIVPVLVDDAEFPRPELMPASLRPLVQRQAMALRHSSFQHDVARLIQELAASFFGESQRPEGRGKQKAESQPEDDVFDRLRTLVQGALTSNVPLARLLAAVEEVSRDALIGSCAIEDLEEHLRGFPGGTTRPAVLAQLEGLLWKGVLDSPDPRMITEYLERFPHGAHVERARSMRDQLIARMGGFDPDTPRLFLNYRRVDSQDTVDRVYAILSQTVPPQNIVMDVDRKSITPGLPVEPQLQRLVSDCDVMFALIHSRWTEELHRRQAEHESGQQIDFVRAELKCALERGDSMPVVPILAEGVEHPRPADLPEDIRELSKRSSIHLSRARFSEDVLGLLSRITSHFRKLRATRTQ